MISPFQPNSMPFATKFQENRVPYSAKTILAVYSEDFVFLRAFCIFHFLHGVQDLTRFVKLSRTVLISDIAHTKNKFFNPTLSPTND